MNTAIQLALLLMTAFAPVSCRRFHTTSEGCCTDISVDRVLDEPPVPDEVETGRVNVELRFDSNAVVATLADRNRKTIYFYSQDGGNTWRHDAFYQDLRAWQSHILRDGEILPGIQILPMRL